MLKFFVKSLMAQAAVVFLASGCNSNAEEQKNADSGKTHVAGDVLNSFGEDNPKCQLWTDWRQMCSRTGPNGETVCVNDPDRQVEPSEPFCTDSSLGYDALSLNESQTQSVLRFCDVLAEMELPTTENGQRVMVPITLCQKFDSDRPFNGRRVAARLHPWCGEWSDSATGTAVCTVSSADGNDTPRCDALAAESYEQETRMFCSKWELPDWCREGRDFYDYVSGRPAPTDEAQDYSEVIYFESQPPTAAPVYGVQCEMTQAAFEKLQGND